MPITGDDGLTTVAELNDFLRTWQFTGSRTRDAKELSAVRELRTELHRLWITKDDQQLVDQVNDLLQRTSALPQLVRHDHWGWHVHATSADRPLVDRLAVETAMAMIDVIRSEEWSRLRTCAAQDCSDVLVDLSRNRSRRFCDNTCANTTHVKAYRARRKSREG